jgi:hypothetical protein
MLSLILVGSYNIVKGFWGQDTELTTVATQPLLQIHSPQNNATYHTYLIPLNITGNNPTVKITYSLDGTENITYTKTTETLNRHQVCEIEHQLSVYAFDVDGNLVDYQTLNFTITGPQMTQQESQETFSYFESQGLSFEPDYWWLIEGYVNFERKEDFVAFVKERGITAVKVKNDDPAFVSFYVYVEGRQPVLPDTFVGYVNIYTHEGPPLLPFIYSFTVWII